MGRFMALVLGVLVIIGRIVDYLDERDGFKIDRFEGR